MNTFFDQKDAYRMGKILIFLGIIIVLYMGMKFANETKQFGTDRGDLTKMSTIDVSGTGIAFAIPDVASESFTVEEKASTVHEAQTTVSTKVNSIVAFLKTAGVAEKDVQTTNYSAYPEYNYPIPCTDRICPATSSQPKLLGYTVSEMVTVKIRDTSSVGKIIDGLGTLGVTGLSGPDFTVDNTDVINAAARAKAITDAKAKAQVLANDLGVSLVRIVKFSENNGGGYAVPMYAKADMAGGGAAPTSQLPAGQNKYTSDVTITYEIE